jgi:CBS domain-containing protein
VSTAPLLPATAPPVDLDAPVHTVARRATVLAETTPLPEAWTRLHEDPVRCGVVVRDGLPIGVVTAGGLAECWPAGGPLVQHRRTVHELLDRPCGVEVLDENDSVRHAGHRLLATGLPALPVRSLRGGPLRLVTTTAVLSAVLGGELPA